jgi:putative nucleotidyltransferase with HDIG domain
MDRIEALKKKVDALYLDKNTSRAKDWADYLYARHVFKVADKARELAERFGADAELAEAAGMLHDIADAVMPRQDPRHEKESETIARSFLRASGFSAEEIEIVVDDALKNHSCREGEVPQTLEGKVMATADAVVHLQTDFYDFAVKNFTERGEAPAHISEWGLEKTDRDFNKKIFFDEVREEVRPDYEKQRRQFAALAV